MMLRACLVVAWLAAPVLADPALHMTPEQSFIAEQMATLQEQLNQAKPLPARALNEIVQLSLVEGGMKFEVVARDVGEDAVISLKGAKGVCRIQRFGSALPVQNAMQISVHLVDVEQAKAVEINLRSIGSFNFDVISTTPGVAMTTQLIAPIASPFGVNDAEPRFHVQVIDENGSGTTPSIQHSAGTVAKLIDENHDQLLESAGDGFRALRAMHLLSAMGEAEVKSMLAANASAAPEVQKQIEGAVQTMRADPDAGEKQLQTVLQTTGPAAANVLAHMSREGWSADLTMRIDNILAPFLLQDSNVASHVNSQPHRLVDLLYWPDPSIRRSALDRIRALSKVPTDIDPVADPYSQFERIEGLRAQLTPSP